MLSEFVPFLAPAISFAGFLVVIYQLRRNSIQRELDSVVKIGDTNRQLLTLGFSFPAVFKILDDAEGVDPALEKIYLQMWVNSFLLVHSYMRESVFKRELKDALTRDVSEFLQSENMQRHWRKYGTAYPDSFQKFVNEIMEKVEPLDAAQLGSGV